MKAFENINVVRYILAANGTLGSTGLMGNDTLNASYEPTITTKDKAAAATLFRMNNIDAQIKAAHVALKRAAGAGDWELLPERRETLKALIRERSKVVEHYNKHHNDLED